MLRPAEQFRAREQLGAELSPIQDRLGGRAPSAYGSATRSVVWFAEPSSRGTTGASACVVEARLGDAVGRVLRRAGASTPNRRGASRPWASPRCGAEMCSEACFTGPTRCFAEPLTRPRTCASDVRFGDAVAGHHRTGDRERRTTRVSISARRTCVDRVQLGGRAARRGLDRRAIYR